jgi:hypothetical protein
MPHEFFAGMTGNCHAKKTKGSPFEHDTHGYGDMNSPLKPTHPGIAAAVEKEKRLAGLKG